MGLFDRFRTPDYEFTKATFAGANSAKDSKTFNSDFYSDVDYVFAKMEMMINKLVPFHWFVKILKPDGSLLTFPNSPQGYTIEFRDKLPGEKTGKLTLSFPGIGLQGKQVYDTPGQWQYILYNEDGKLLISSTFHVTSSREKFRSKGFMRLKEVEFADVEKDGTIISDFEPMRTGLFNTDVKYLKARILYDGLCQEARKIKLDIKISKPDKSLIEYDDEVTVKPEGGIIRLSGWGNPSGTCYEEGYYNYRILFEGNQLYSMTFYIEGTLRDNNYIKLISFTAHEANSGIQFSRYTVDEYQKKIYLDFMNRGEVKVLPGNIPDSMVEPFDQEEISSYRTNSIDFVMRLLYYGDRPTKIYMKLIGPDRKVVTPKTLAGTKLTYSIECELSTEDMLITASIAKFNQRFSDGRIFIPSGYYSAYLYTINQKDQIILLEDLDFNVK